MSRKSDLVGYMTVTEHEVPITAKDRRMELGRRLKSILGNSNVYFQPPNNASIKYPCIIYNKEKPAQRHADDMNYYNMAKYEVLVIDRDPDSELPDNINSEFPYCEISRHFVKDNLNQTLLTLYY